MHRILFFAGTPYAIYTYGFFLSFAMMIGMGITLKRAPKAGLSSEQAMDFMLLTCISGLIGARIVAVWKDWSYYAAAPWTELFNFRGGGLAFHGSVLGGFLAFWIYTGRLKLNRQAIMDMSTPGLILGHALGRLGCFFNACCYGRETTVPWAITNPDAPELHFLPRHPCQLYEAVAEPLVLLCLLAFQKRYPVRGVLFYGYMCLYAIERFVVEFFRQERLLPGGLDLAQYASIPIFVVGLLALRQTLNEAPQALDPKGEAHAS